MKIGSHRFPMPARSRLFREKPKFRKAAPGSPEDRLQNILD